MNVAETTTTVARRQFVQTLWAPTSASALQDIPETACRVQVRGGRVADVWYKGGCKFCAFMQYHLIFCIASQHPCIKVKTSRRTYGVNISHRLVLRFYWEEIHTSVIMSCRASIDSIECCTQVVMLSGPTSFEVLCYFYEKSEFHFDNVKLQGKRDGKTTQPRLKDINLFSTKIIRCV